LKTIQLRLQLPNYKIAQLLNLFHFFMRRVLAATATELFELQPLRGRLPVFGGRIIPLFAITALQCHYFSGHKTSS
jgi:hypothetical protein